MCRKGRKGWNSVHISSQAKYIVPQHMIHSKIMAIFEVLIKEKLKKITQEIYLMEGKIEGRRERGQSKFKLLFRPVS